MTAIQCRYTGDLHCTAQHGPSGSVLNTDAPTDHDGLGESFSPTDLLATALGTCLLTIMGITARRRGWDLADASVIVEKTMTSEGPRRIQRLEAQITLPVSLSQQQKALLKRVANDCPVKRNLDSSMTIDLIWSDASPTAD
ncbi:OsmC family protein [Synechococcus sp. ROS8604]|uniref:OsmC family protein n=1 Tax=Synechococcus sp. ROS8604 TaxID=1442557 RepID=UPI001645869C|nr:OsmC family protein [Synechococcus sp. ROS8604]